MGVVNKPVGNAGCFDIARACLIDTEISLTIITLL